MPEGAKGKVQKKLIQAVRKGLRANAVPEDAAIMQAYMKSDMPNYGVKMPIMRQIVKECDAKFPITNRDDFIATVLDLWRTAKFREVRHAAIDITRQRRYNEFQDPSLLGFYEEIITSGAWWDFVDAIAPYRLGEILRANPKVMTQKMLAWGKAKNFWIRRSSIICQLKAKDKTDVDLFFTNILASVDDDEFFIRKAIGWSLREHSKTDPQAVLKFVKKHKNKLSTLSKREALRRMLSKEELQEFLA
ncbi:MAG: 3-methyladenine DNA glycosylase AlkD [Planctomycetota bacterium]|jgi:3-methyladenine DNA glycosylase AlkD